MNKKYTKSCVICLETFHTNYSSRLSCSEDCKAERKRLQKIEAYNANKHVERKRTRNSFLRMSAHK